MSVIAEWGWSKTESGQVLFVEKINRQTEAEVIIENERIDDIKKTKESTDISEKMEERTRIMQKACQKYRLDNSGPDSLHEVNPWEYFINVEHKLVWCNIFKAASTSWMYIFNVLAGYSPKYLKKTRKVPLTLARAKYPRPSSKQLKEVLSSPNVTSIIIGRFYIRRKNCRLCNIDFDF